MLLTLLLPFIVRFNGIVWHDTIHIVLAPNLPPTPFDYYASDKPSIIFAIYFGTPHEYDPTTGSIGAVIYTPDAGIVHSHGEWLRQHIDSFTESLIKHQPYEFIGYSKPGKPHRVIVYNNTNKWIWIDLTIWVAEFPNEYVEIGGKRVTVEDALKIYLSSIADMILKGFTPPTPMR